MCNGETILDDGQFYIELNVNYEPSVAPGFLQRRCSYGVTTPSGFECVGSFQKSLDGTWSADVSAPLNEDDDSDCLLIAKGVNRMEAIVALWRNRQVAFCSRR